MSNYTPGIPPLSGIKDPDTRRVLEALVNGWRTRNGETKPDSDQRFVTKGELADLARDAAVQYVASAQGVRAITDAMGDAQAELIQRVLADLQRDVFNSPLWRALGGRIALIDDKYSLEVGGLIQELDAASRQILGLQDGSTDIVIRTPSGLSSIRALKDSVYDPVTGLATAVGAIGEINTITLTSKSAAARRIFSVAAQVNDAETGLELANGNITEINTVTATSQSVNARQLHGVQAAVFDQATGLAVTRAAVLELSEAIVDSNSAFARQLTAVSAQVGQKNKVFFQTTAPESTDDYTLRVNDVWYDSDDKNKPYRWSGSAWVETTDGRIGDVNTLVTDEKITRANSDNAMAAAIQTVWAELGDGSALVQQGANGYVNNTGAVATKWNQTQAALRGSDGALISSATVKETAEAAVNKAGVLEGRYTVKIDVNGHVSGFGLASQSNNSIPTSEFIVRADRFAIGAPFAALNFAAYVDNHPDLLAAFTASGQTNKATFGFNHYYPQGQIENRVVPNQRDVAPFIVTTVNETLADGTVLPPGVYIDYAMVKRLDGAFINAGLLKAAKIYSGSQYVDFDSRYDIPAAGYGSIAGSPSDTTIPFTSSGVRFYGPSGHPGAPYYQRVRIATSSNLVSFTVTACATADHYMSIWYRRNAGAWVWIAKVIEPQNGDGMAAIATTIALTIATGDFIDFAASGSNESNVFIDSGKKYLKDLTLTVQTVNL